MKVCELIRKLRIEQGLTMKQLGAKVGVTEQAISQYEIGKREPNDEMLENIFKALNVDFGTYKEALALHPYFEMSKKYLYELISHLEKKDKSKIEGLNYVTVREIDYFLTECSKYIHYLIEKHAEEDMPDSDIIINIK